MNHKDSSKKQKQRSSRGKYNQELLQKVKELKPMVKDLRKSNTGMQPAREKHSLHPELTENLSTISSLDSKAKAKESEFSPSINHPEEIAQGFLLNNKFEDMILAVPHTLIMIDDSGRIILWNKIAEKMYGFSSTEVLGRCLEEVVVAEPYRGILKKRLNDFKKRISIGTLNKIYEMESKRRNGSTFTSELYLSSLKMDNRNYFMVVVKDVSGQKKLKNMLDNIVNILIRFIELRDPYTAGHQRKVTKLAIAIARDKHLSRQRIEVLKIASLLHDVGKMVIPMEILNKPSSLSNYEFDLIKNHCQAGYQILKEIGFSRRVREIILQHHERVDGSGYPRGLKGDKILLEAKILAVADVVEAMTSHRPYRPALEMNEAQKEIRQNRGILFDAELADICLKLFKEEKFIFNSISTKNSST